MNSAFLSEGSCGGACLTAYPTLRCMGCSALKLCCCLGDVKPLHACQVQLTFTWSCGLKLNCGSCCAGVGQAASQAILCSLVTCCCARIWPCPVTHRKSHGRPVAYMLSNLLNISMSTHMFQSVGDFAKERSPSSWLVVEACCCTVASHHCRYELML